MAVATHVHVGAPAGAPPGLPEVLEHEVSEGGAGGPYGPRLSPPFLSPPLPQQTMAGEGGGGGAGGGGRGRGVTKVCYQLASSCYQREGGASFKQEESGVEYTSLAPEGSVGTRHTRVQTHKFSFSHHTTPPLARMHTHVHTHTLAPDTR